MQPSSPIKRLGRRLLRPRISLRGLLILVALVSVAFFGVASVRRAYEDEQAARRILESELGFSFETDTILPAWVFRAIARERLAWFERASKAFCSTIRDEGAVRLGQDPAELAQFPRIADCRYLKTLQLEGLALDDQQFSSIADLRDLEHLHLESLDIPGESLGVLSGFAKLRGLHVTNCPLEPASLSVVAEIKGLQSLILSGLEVTTSTLRNLDVSELQGLSLEDTLVDDETSLLLSRCDKLIVLNLGGCKITDDTLIRLKTCRSLQVIHLDRTLVSGSGFADLRHLDIGILFLGGSQLDDAGAAALAQVQSIELLVVSRTKITATGLKHLASLPKLIDLKADKVELDSAALDGIKFSANLVDISFDDTGLDDRAVDALLTIPTSVSNLSVLNCPISQAGMARLRARFQNVQNSY